MELFSSLPRSAVEDGQHRVDAVFDFDSSLPPYAGPRTRPSDDKEYIKALERENARLMEEKRDAYHFTKLQLLDLHTQTKSLLGVGLRVNCYLPQLTLLQRQLLEIDQALTFFEEGHAVAPNTFQHLIAGWQRSLAARTTDVLERVSECNTTTACTHALDLEVGQGPATMKDLALGRRVKDMIKPSEKAVELGLAQERDLHRYLPADLKEVTGPTQEQNFYSAYFRSTKSSYIQSEMTKALGDLMAEGHRQKHSTRVCPDLPQPGFKKAMRRVSLLSRPSNPSGSWMTGLINAVSGTEEQHQSNVEKYEESGRPDWVKRERNIQEFLANKDTISQRTAEEDLIQIN